MFTHHYSGPAGAVLCCRIATPPLKPPEMLILGRSPLALSRTSSRVCSFAAALTLHALVLLASHMPTCSLLPVD